MNNGVNLEWWCSEQLAGQMMEAVQMQWWWLVVVANGDGKWHDNNQQ